MEKIQRKGFKGCGIKYGMKKIYLINKISKSIVGRVEFNSEIDRKIFLETYKESGRFFLVREEQFNEKRNSLYKAVTSEIDL